MTEAESPSSGLAQACASSLAITKSAGYMNHRAAARNGNGSIGIDCLPIRLAVGRRPGFE